MSQVEHSKIHKPTQVWRDATWKNYFIEHFCHVIAEVPSTVSHYVRIISSLSYQKVYSLGGPDLKGGPYCRAQRRHWIGVVPKSSSSSFLPKLDHSFLHTSCPEQTLMCIFKRKWRSFAIFGVKSIGFISFIFKTRINDLDCWKDSTWNNSQVPSIPIAQISDFF